MKERDCGAPYRSTEKIEVEKLRFGKKMKPGGRSSSRGISVGTSRNLLQGECGRITAEVSCLDAFVPEA